MGTILKVDVFGNLITNLHVNEFPDVKAYPMELRVGVERVTRLAQTFADSVQGELIALVGSSGYIEVAVNQGSAAKVLGVGAGSPVELEIFYDGL